VVVVVLFFKERVVWYIIDIALVYGVFMGLWTMYGSILKWDGWMDHG